MVGRASIGLRTAPTPDAIFDGFLACARDDPHGSAVSSASLLPATPSFCVVPGHIVCVQGLSPVERRRCFLVLSG